MTTHPESPAVERAVASIEVAKAGVDALRKGANKDARGMWIAICVAIVAGLIYGVIAMGRANDRFSGADAVREFSIRDERRLKDLEAQAAINLKIVAIGAGLDQVVRDIGRIDATLTKIDGIFGERDQRIRAIESGIARIEGKLGTTQPK